MLKVYVFWGLFGLVLVGIGVTLILRRMRGQNGQPEAVESSAAAAPSESPAASPPPAAYDPNATRIHFRTSPVGRASPLLKREETTLPPTGSARLVCVGGTRKGNSFSVTAAGIKVGRDPQNDIVISDPRVSYHHAWIGIIDHKAVLRDLGSTNGTFLNAQMDALVSEVVLSPDDTIFFGGHGGEQFRFVVD
ncbi:MAG: FHA domain-containing protein [Sulfuritalea sp.]|nr:FHA domain-containing protein [Sulfuritalea sp.]